MLTLMFTSSKLEQAALVIVQRKTLVPVPRLVTAELGWLLLVNVPAPDNKDQLPVPTEAAFPVREVELTVIFWSFPATAVVGSAFTVNAFVCWVPTQPPAFVSVT